MKHYLALLFSSLVPIAIFGVASAAELEHRPINPNPLLAIGDVQFKPIADAILLSDVYNGPGCTQLVYLTPAIRAQMRLNPNNDAHECQARILNTARPAAVAALKALPGKRSGDNVDALLLDPRIYARVISVLDEQRRHAP